MRYGRVAFWSEAPLVEREGLLISRIGFEAGFEADMALGGALIYVSSFVLERNRWSQKGPSLLVSEWVEAIAEAGFSGFEIWAPHLFLTSRSEWESIRELSRNLDLPVAFVRTQIPTDSGDKSCRQRDFLLEAADYFEPQGLKFTLAEGLENSQEKLEFLRQWALDLPRGVALVSMFEASDQVPEAIQNRRRILAERFRCAINPFSAERPAVEACLQAAGSDLVDLDVGIRNGNRYVPLRERQKTCAELAAWLGRADFTGSWTLAGAQGMGASGENSDDLFDAAETDLNFLMEELEHSGPSA